VMQQPMCPRCHRRELPEKGAMNFVIHSQGKLEAYFCGESMSWHIWVPGIESHQDEYAR
jgi:hypothetical protein